jgi:hypothetical protein
MFAKFIAHLACLFGSVILGVMVLMFGWGMEVQSWGWIIGGCFFQIILLIVNIVLARES